MSTHAPFPPSAADRWMTCTASFALSLQVPPPPSSSYAEEGSRLHEVAAAHLDAPQDEPFVPEPEDLAFLKPYIDYVTERRDAGHRVLIESRLEYNALLSGTTDALVIGPDRDTLEVIDLKCGYGIQVSPEENKQLLTYAFLQMARMAERGWGQVSDDKRSLVARLSADQPDPWQFLPPNVRLTIVQPPAEEPVKSWDTTRERVQDHGVQVLAAIDMALSGNSTYVPGEHCRWCPGKGICPKLRGEVTEALGGELPAGMTTASLAQWLDRADRMEGFINQVRLIGHTVATEALAQGLPGIPGWTLKPKRATRTWADEDEVLRIARQRKIKIYQDKLLSPAMAEKAHPNLPEDLRKQIVAVSSGTNLVRGESTHQVIAQPASLAASLKLAKYRV